MENPVPSPELLNQVRGAFVAQGITFTEWCRANGVDPRNARLTLLGGWNGPKGLEWRKKILIAAGLNKVAAA
jgi:hypothetical protein